MTTRHVRMRRFLAPVAMAVAIGVVAFGCSKTDPNASGNPADSGETTPTAPQPAAVPEVVKTASGQPKAGGKLVFGLEAETDGFDPTSNRWAAGGFEEASAFFDPLVTLDANLDPKPFLVESFSAADGFYTWDMHLRKGITYQDGETFDANSVNKDLQLVLASPLTGASLSAVDKIEITDPYTLRVHMKTAWSAFPYALTLQIGFMAAPKQLDDKDQGPSHPVGTGPFIFKSWDRDNKLVVDKNPDYWQKGLPYLDEVEFRPIVDTNSRLHSLQAGDINALITSAEPTIKQMTADASQGDYQLIHSHGNNDVNLIMDNVSVAPLNDLRVRQAMAYALDRKVLDDVSQTDPLLSADSMFQPDSKWYSAQPNYPAFDLEKAKALVKQYEAEKGPVEFTFGSTTDNDVLQATQAIATMWQAAGIKVDIQTFDQATFISKAVTGQFQVDIWRQFGAADPDINYQWFIGANASGTLTLNMSRNVDPQVDKFLQDGRSTIDFNVRKKAYDGVVDRQTQDLNYIWLNHTRWVMAADNKLRGIQGYKLPDGSMSAGLVSGINPVTGMWFDN